MACRLVGAKPLPEPMLALVNWTPRNKLQWNVNRNSYIFIQENSFENVVWKMAATLSRPQCVKSALLQERVALWSRDAYMCQLICVSSKGGGGGIDSDNGLSMRVRCQVIIWTNTGLILTGPLGTFLSDQSNFYSRKSIENGRRTTVATE